MSDPWAHLTRAERLVLAAELKALAEDREFMESAEANDGGWAQVWLERLKDADRG